MATVYSLVCFGGLSGKTVTFTDSGDVVNLTNHGLRQGVTGVVFSTTGSLPTGITAGTTYYPRDGADANKFTIYPTKADALAGTNQVTFTGTGSGTHTVKSARMLSAELSRYGNTRVYDGIASWKTSRASSGVQANDTEIAEIIDAFTEITTVRITLDLACFEQRITTLVSGTRSDGFHGGVVGGGYILKCTTDLYSQILPLTKPKRVIDGISIYTGHKYAYGISAYDSSSVNSIIKNNILFGTSTGASGIIQGGIRLFASGCKVYNNIICGIGSGFYLESSVSGLMLYNNLAVKIVGTGFNRNTSAYAWIYNNASIGCTTNWAAAPTSTLAMSKNAGISTDTPWNDGSGSITSLTTSHFVDYTNNDFRPTSSSPLVNVGINVFGEEAIDIIGDVRPNYQPLTYPNEVWDVGPFEYDHGNGLAPLQVTLYISGIAEGSILAVYKSSDGSAIVSPTTIGASGSYSATYSYTGDTQIEVVVRKGSSGTKYLPYSASGLITSTGFSLIVNQVVDGLLNG